MESKIILSILCAIVLLVVGLSVAATDTVSVNITIQAVSQITVLPDSLNWTGLSPGVAGGVYNLTIENTGSQNVTNIHAYVNTNETEAVRPYTLSDALNYSSGGLLVLKNNSDQRYYWGQKKEWNWSTDIANIDLTNLGLNRAKTARGFLRNGTYDYVWAAVNGTNSTNTTEVTSEFFYCNNTGALFAIEDDADLGTQATRTPTTTGITRDGGDAQYGYFSVSDDRIPLNNSCVAVHYTCSYILAYKFDKRTSPNFNSCANAAHFRSAALVPGSQEDMKADAWVPMGVPSGQMRVATLTIEAT